MIDTFALVLSHALLAICAWRLYNRDDLDADDAAPRAKRGGAWGRRSDA
jgi:hypothetical protein